MELSPRWRRGFRRHFRPHPHLADLRPQPRGHVVVGRTEAVLAPPCVQIRCLTQRRTGSTGNSNSPAIPRDRSSLPSASRTMSSRNLLGCGSVFLRAIIIGHLLLPCRRRTMLSFTKTRSLHALFGNRPSAMTALYCARRVGGFRLQSSTWLAGCCSPARSRFGEDRVATETQNHRGDRLRTLLAMRLLIGCPATQRPCVPQRLLPGSAG